MVNLDAVISIAQLYLMQAVFRGLQVRRQYRKIVWSVGVLEKAIFRWRLKRRGFRGLQVSPDEAVVIDPKQESDVEEDFFRASRNQAEERVERSVVRVQALFRSKRAQQEYQRMKLAYNEAMVGNLCLYLLVTIESVYRFTLLTFFYAVGIRRNCNF